MNSAAYIQIRNLLTIKPICSPRNNLSASSRPPASPKRRLHHDIRTAHPGLSPQFSEAKGKPLSIKKLRSVSGFRHLSVQEGGTGPETETEDIRTPPYNEQGSRKEADKRRVSGVFTNDTGSGKRRNKFKVKSGPSPPFSIYRRQNTVRTSLARPPSFTIFAEDRRLFGNLGE